MMPSTCRRTATRVRRDTALPSAEGLHVAIIMDGNGRWAGRRGLPRSDGHRAGASAVRRIASAAPALGIDLLTLYAFSSDNWKRPAHEVALLMELLTAFLNAETERCVAEGIRISLLGRRDRLPAETLEAVRSCEARTRGGARLHVRLAVDYSARDSLLTAAAHVGGDLPMTRAGFACAIAQAGGSDVARDVDLVIRTGGERRLSDFLLWEAAYAELLFTPRPWPEFDEDDLAAAIAEFRQRDRRFGGLSAPDSIGAVSIAPEAVR